MKKFIASLLAAAFLLSFTIGCGETPKANVKDKESATVKENKATVKEKESASTKDKDK